MNIFQNKVANSGLEYYPKLTPKNLASRSCSSGQSLKCLGFWKNLVEGDPLGESSMKGSRGCSWLHLCLPEAEGSGEALYCCWLPAALGSEEADPPSSSLRLCLGAIVLLD